MWILYHNTKTLSRKQKLNREVENMDSKKHKRFLWIQTITSLVALIIAIISLLIRLKQ